MTQPTHRRYFQLTLIFHISCGEKLKSVLLTKVIHTDGFYIGSEQLKIFIAAYVKENMPDYTFGGDYAILFQTEIMEEERDYFETH